MTPSFPVSGPLVMRTARPTWTNVLKAMRWFGEGRLLNLMMAVSTNWAVTKIQALRNFIYEIWSQKASHHGNCTNPISSLNFQNLSLR
jgi:hypothetical protein